MNLNNYKYYLFYRNNPNHPRTILAKDLDLKGYIFAKYPTLKSVKNLSPNAVVYIFNSCFNSNEELMDAVVELYKENHPRFNTNADFDYITLIAEGHNAEDYGFLKYSYSTKDFDYTKERLIPIIYHSDFSALSKLDTIKVTELNNPALLINKIINAKFNNMDDSNKKYVENLERVILSILKNKYNNNVIYVNNTDYDNNFIDEEYDVQSIHNLLFSFPIYEQYPVDSTVFYNLLSVIIFHERVNTLGKKMGQTYDPLHLTMNNKKISEYNLALLSFSSKSDFYNQKEQEREMKRIAEPSVLSYEEAAQKVLDEYNFSHDTFISIADLDFMPEQYEEIINQINDLLYNQPNDNQRK